MNKIGYSLMKGSDMQLDLSSLEKALKSLERAILRSRKTTKDEELRDAVIQRFEYTYELSWKMMKRQIELESPTPSAIDAWSFRDLLREATEKGLVENIEQWFAYRDARNLTSHTYDEKNAKQVYEVALQFFEDAKLLCNRLKKKDDQPDIDIRADYLEGIKKILAKFVPHYKVMAFGSRVAGKAKKHSDLDLVICPEKPIPIKTMALMKEAFSESDLPFKVDLVDWSLISDEFKQLIEKKNVIIQK